MSAKLIVQKFEPGINFKSLNIIIEDIENDTSEIQFGKWLDGSLVPKKKQHEGSSRLVVRVVSEDEPSSFNLDTCAKELDQSNSPVQMNQSIADQLHKINKNQISHNHSENQLQMKRDSQSFFYFIRNMENNGDSTDCPSPLEYSLERVKENNAHIMENINMLNRTLNYTKCKEIQEIAYQRPMRSYPCKACGKCFVYETGLRRHYAMRHAVSVIQPSWQDVWTCVECFQVWPYQDAALQHSNQCCKPDNILSPVREIKTSSLLQCEFCEKVFTSIPRLLRHSKTHTTANNYECNACEIAFSSYKDAEQHWTMCRWLKMCYNFSLPKLLLCNACDRKFKNYDQLYNHRYKVGHFMTKTHNSKIVKSFGILLYQCELCGQCLPSISQLQGHRGQKHSCQDTGVQYPADTPEIRERNKRCYNEEKREENHN